MSEDAAPEESSFSSVLVVDDEESIRHMLGLMLERAGLAVESVDAGEAAIELLERRGDIDVVLTDVRMPGIGGLELVDWIHAHRPDLTTIVMSAFGTVELALDAMHRGAYDYVSKPFKLDEVVLTLRKAEERQRLRRENAVLRAQVEDVDDARGLGDMLVSSRGMRSVLRLVQKVAPFQTTVLVLGESGVGKELVSRAIHALSPRLDGPFVAVNCGAIPDALLESELFGHVKGAFTDANTDRAGLFVEAQGGTLFLDEIGELPLSLQVKLLRALQEGEIRPVGSSRTRQVDVRLVAATSRDLSSMVDEGTFRQDLFYRLNVMVIEIPPLRERRDDITALLMRFVARTNERLGLAISSVSDAALKRFLTYDWPGNVRELENAVEHAAVMADGSSIEVEHLPARIARSEPRGETFNLRLPSDDLSVKRAQRTLERELILRALERTGGNRTHAAKLLELSHRALLYKIKDFELT